MIVTCLAYSIEPEVRELSASCPRSCLVEFWPDSHFQSIYVLIWTVEEDAIKGCTWSHLTLQPQHSGDLLHRKGPSGRLQYNIREESGEFKKEFAGRLQSSKGYCKRKSGGNMMMAAAGGRQPSTTAELVVYGNGVSSISKVSAVEGEGSAGHRCL